MNRHKTYKEHQDHDKTHQEAKQTKNTIRRNDTQVSNKTENSIGNYNKYCYIPDEAFQ